MRTKLYVAAAKVNTQPTRSNPRCRSWRSIPTVFIHPKTSSIRFRFLAYLITRVSSGALVQPASAATLVLGDMRCNSHASQFLDELPLVVSFICSQRDSPAAWQLFRHQQPGMTLRRTVGRGHLVVPHQSAPILRHQIPVVAQFRFLSWSLAGQHGLRIGGGTVCLISAFLSAIVDRGVILVPPCRRWFRLLVVLLAHRIAWAAAFRDRSTADRRVRRAC